jgi:hypothetical protein
VCFAESGIVVGTGAEIEVGIGVDEFVTGTGVDVKGPGINVAVGIHMVEGIDIAGGVDIGGWKDIGADIGVGGSFDTVFVEVDGSFSGSVGARG